MKKTISLLILVSMLMVTAGVDARIIDYDRKMGLLKMEGTVVAVDRKGSKITVKNVLTGKNVSYQAADELLENIFEDDKVLIKFKRNTSIAHSIEKKRR